MKTKILVCGLPGSGKTTLANALAESLILKGNVVCSLNADELREYHNDWDFSLTGRFRQAVRMRDLAEESSADFVIADFVAPIRSVRQIYQADYVVFMDTITEGRFADTNALFKKPYSPDCTINTFDSYRWATIIAASVTAI